MLTWRLLACPHDCRSCDETYTSKFGDRLHRTFEEVQFDFEHMLTMSQVTGQPTQERNATATMTELDVQKRSCGEKRPQDTVVHGLVPG